MDLKKRLIRWAIALVLMGAGVTFAFIGRRLFVSWGLPVWSDGDRGWNYVGVIAFVICSAGISVFNSTLSEKVRSWIWAVVVAATLLLTFG